MAVAVSPMVYSEANALLADLQDALAGKPDKVPPGFKTAKAWAEEWDKSRNHTLKLLAAGVAKDILETDKFRIMTAGGLKPVPHYRRKRNNGG